MRLAINLSAILVVGLVLGLIGRYLRYGVPEAIGPGPEDVVYTADVAPGEEPEVNEDEIHNDEVIQAPQDEAWLSRFELTERSGELVKSEELLGSPYIVSFFFARCPSVCPQQNQKLAELQKKFKGQDIRLIAITVDPENDTPEVLREYAARFAADKDQWLFLTGDLLYIRRVGAEIYQQPIDKGAHTERFILVDRKGEIDGIYTWSEPKQYEKLVERIEEILAG